MLYPGVHANPEDDQNDFLCAFIAATNVATVYTKWSCTAGGVTTTDPCTDSWPQISCDGNDLVDDIDLHSDGITGIYGTVDVLYLCWNY